ncbi:MAG: META domain-containing protein [Acidimicrobiales bacterium]
MIDLRQNLARLVAGLFMLVGVALVLAACGSSADTVAGGSAADETSDGTADGETSDETSDEVTVDGEPRPIDLDALRSGSWILRYGGGPEGEIELVDGWPITITFDGETLGGTAACNGYGAEYVITDPQLRIEEISQNLAGCEPAVQAAEQAYMAALLDVDGINLIGDELALSGPATELIFVRTAPVAMADLIGTLWFLESTTQDGVATPVQGEPATLLLNPDGTVTGSTGCRTLSGTYTVFGSEVLFPNFGADGDCPSALAEQDGKVVTVLGDGFVPQVDDGTLVLTSSGNEGLVYRAITEQALDAEAGSAVPSDAELLDSIEWVFAGGDSSDGPIADPRTIDPAQQITLTFTTDGYRGDAICNGYGGEAELGSGRITLGVAEGEQEGCGEPFDAIVQTFYDALPLMTEFGLQPDGAGLVMNGNDIELLFERAAR